MVSSVQYATLDEVRQVPTPAAPRTHHPIPHDRLISLARASLANHGYRPEVESYELDCDGQRLFATWDLVRQAGETFGRDVEGTETRLSCGLRNAHDERFASGVCLGSRVLVCSNLEFGAEFQLGRKHTRNINRDLPDLLSELAGKVPEFSAVHEARINAYRCTAIDDAAAHDLIIRSVDAAVISNQAVPAVLGYWRNPPHEAFEDRTAWSLLNAYTEHLKSTNQFELATRTRRLHPLLAAAAAAAGAVSLPEPAAELIDSSGRVVE